MSIVIAVQLPEQPDRMTCPDVWVSPTTRTVKVTVVARRALATLDVIDTPVSSSVHVPVHTRIESAYARSRTSCSASW